MVRRGRSASPPPATRRTTPASHAPSTPNVSGRYASTSSPAKHPPATIPSAASSVPAAAPTTPPVAAQQSPSMMKEMAATAGSVALGSTVGHVVGHGITSLLRGSGETQVAAAAPAETDVARQPHHSQYATPEPEGPCAFELKQFLECAQGQSDITLCQGFNEALRLCKAKHNLHNE